MSGLRGAIHRLILALVAACLLAGLAWGLALAGVSACRPAALPGDEAWMRLFLMREAGQVLLGFNPAGCILAAGVGLIDWAPRLAAVAGLLPLAVVLWEVAGWRLRLWGLRRVGGHAILAGTEASLTRMARGRATVWLLPEGAKLTGPGQLVRHVLTVPDQAEMAGLLHRVGVARAALLVAATADDLANFRLARAALEAGFAGRLVVRLDGRDLRGLAVDSLRRAAGRADLVIAAPGLVQAREALALTMPGRVLDEVADHVSPHIALCGDGLKDIAQLIARQGFGLERGVPRLSVLQIGGAATLEGAAIAPPDVLEVAVTTVPADETERLETAIADLVTRGPRLTAILCRSDSPGRASLLAARWEQVLTDLGLSVPPLVALDERGVGAGSVLVASRPDLAEVEARQAILDARARNVHEHYLHLARDAGMAGLATQQPWADLAETIREENRAVADHIRYKLALVGMMPWPGATGGRFSTTQLDRLARAEHARWVAARRVAGWQPGPRDDAQRRHPDLVPYNALDRAGQEKDRDQVSHLPDILALGGEGILRLWPLRPGGGDLSAQVLGPKLVAAVQALAARHPGHLPLLCLGASDRDLDLGRRVRAAGFPVELVLPARDAGPVSPGLAALRGKAERLRIVDDPDAVLAQVPAVLSTLGEAHGIDP